MSVRKSTLVSRPVMELTSEYSVEPPVYVSRFVTYLKTGCLWYSNVYPQQNSVNQNFIKYTSLSIDYCLYQSLIPSLINGSLP